MIWQILLWISWAFFSILDIKNDENMLKQIYRSQEFFASLKMKPLAMIGYKEWWEYIETNM